MDDALCPCLVVMPLDYNPDDNGVVNEVEPETMLEITSWFNRQFEGWRTLGQSGMAGVPPGSWRGQSDRSITIVVGLPEARTPEFVKLVRAIGVKLKQKAMYYEIGPPIAWVMEIEETEGPSVGG